jgi:class 3 adenylate cyclase
MPRVSLKNLLSPKGENHALLVSLVGELHAEIQVEDTGGQILIGKLQNGSLHQELLTNEEEIIGWVKGDDKIKIIASLINGWIRKESERKKLGNEVLTLYQEVNMVFDFSEKLAQTISQKEIARIALEEARRLIKSDRGEIVLWGEDKVADIPARYGGSLFDKAALEADPAIRSVFALSEIHGDLFSLKDKGWISSEIESMVYAVMRGKRGVMGAIVLASSRPDQYAAADLKFLVTLALQSASAIESANLFEKNIREAKEKEEAMRVFYEAANKFVPHEFIGSLGRNRITDIQLGDKVEKIVTVLFSDIRDYTTLSEKMTPEENFSFVCSFNERMGPIIRAHHGFINQYLGDAIMAIFPDDPANALEAAIAMQQAVKDLNAGRISQGKPVIKVGVGMHTGPLIMGITGDRERLDAATISDTVNTASRLESLTKLYGVNILLSEASVSSLTDSSLFYFRELGLIQLKGKMAPVSIYECFNGIEEKDFQRKLLALPFYREGIFDYFNKSFKTASANFGRVLEIFPEDKTSRLFLGKANEYLDNGIPDNWTGIVEMNHK